MKLGAVIKIKQNNFKEIDYDAMPANCKVTAIFPIHGQF